MRCRLPAGAAESGNSTSGTTIGRRETNTCRLEYPSYPLTREYGAATIRINEVVLEAPSSVGGIPSSPSSWHGHATL